MDKWISENLFHQNERKSNALLASILWSIWKARNAWVFRSSRLKPQQIMEEASYDLELYIKWSPNTTMQNRKDKQVVRGEEWIPPTTRELKLNVDGSWSCASKQGVVARICRDHHGRLVGGFAKKILAPSALVVETLALKEGLHFVEKTRTSGLQFNEQGRPTKVVPVQIVTDNLTAAEAILGRAEIPWAVQSGVEECKQKLGSLPAVSMGFNPQESNRAVDWIVKACRNDSLVPNWLSYPPHCLTSILCLDLGKCPRFIPRK
ncbi:hypothetical protein ACJRO7_016751 [Eucalyptus globulus]|uniref:RNase H type-1 domain-containing protein n=1 Tax=Eucalyptus globulus TaxID=34317 RepID=A0ABD3KUB7_EUCGL